MPAEADGCQAERCCRHGFRDGQDRTAVGTTSANIAADLVEVPAGRGSVVRETWPHIIGPEPTVRIDPEEEPETHRAQKESLRGDAQPSDPRITVRTVIE
jgi:hypothetical protein